MRISSGEEFIVQPWPPSIFSRSLPPCLKLQPQTTQVSGIDSLGKARALFPDLQQSGAKHVRSWKLLGLRKIWSSVCKTKGKQKQKQFTLLNHPQKKFSPRKIFKKTLFIQESWLLRMLWQIFWRFSFVWRQI